MTRLGYLIKQDNFESSIYHIIDRSGNIHASFDSQFEAEYELRVYYS